MAQADPQAAPVSRGWGPALQAAAPLAAAAAAAAASVDVRGTDAAQKGGQKGAGFGQQGQIPVIPQKSRLARPSICTQSSSATEGMGRVGEGPGAPPPAAWRTSWKFHLKYTPISPEADRLRPRETTYRLWPR